MTKKKKAKKQISKAPVRQQEVGGMDKLFGQPVMDFYPEEKKQQ